MVLTTAPLKVRVATGHGPGELRRLGFSFDESLVSSGQMGEEIQVEGYHLALCKFLLRSLKELYPELPVGSFSKAAVFSVKDEDGDMIRFDSEEQFVSAMPGYQSWKHCLRIEVNVLETSTEIAESEDTATSAPAELETSDSPSMKPRAAESIASTEPAPSEVGSVISFASSMPASSSVSSSSSSSSANAPSSSAQPSTADAAAAAATTDASAADAASSPPQTTAAAPAPAHEPVPSDPAGVADPATPARAFLTQVLPGLADVLARSMYAAQWVPEIMPNTVSAASQGLRSGEPNPLGPAAAGLAAAATAAVSTAANVAASVHSTANNAPAPVESTADRLSSAPTEAPAVTGSTSTPTAATETAPVLHKGVACDMCDVCPIVGTRYKCAVRSDFDLCESCEREAGSDSPFPYLKIRTPTQAPAAIVCLLKPDQPGSLTEASAFKNSTNANPRAGSRSYGMGHARRAARRDNPQQAGWGEGRRNGPRWMRDLARRQQLAAEMAGVPPGVEVLRGARPAWCGPRMQRRREDASSPATTTTGGGNSGDGKEEDPATKNEAADIHDNVQEQASTTADVLDKGIEGASSVPEVSPCPVPAVTDGAKVVDKAKDQTPQAPEYADMLAASMRSLASSMTSSLPAASQDDSGSGPTVTGGSASTSGDGKPLGKPMARFVTDVSVADGSPLPPNTRFVKTWCMRNDGAVTFPVGCRLMPVGGDLMAGPEEGVVIEPRVPGEEFHVSVTLVTPPLSGRYIGYWRLRTDAGQNFGHRIWADVLVTGGTADLVTEGSMDGDWDLVNMQRLSKAVEDTGKHEVEQAADTPVIVTDSVEETPAVSSTVDDIDANDSGIEETKSSDEDKQEQRQEGEKAEEQAQQKPEGPVVPHAAAMKWHRELCSLAEMGFENTVRNVSLLEKHVVSSGNPGMERVLHELLSWHEVTF